MVLSFALTGIGVLIAARMTSFQGFGTIMNFVIMPMWFLSGAMFPPTNLPHWLAALVKINPMTYGVDLIRKLVLGHRFYAFVVRHHVPRGLQRGHHRHRRFLLQPRGILKPRAGTEQRSRRFPAVLKSQFATSSWRGVKRDAQGCCVSISDSGAPLALDRAP